MSTTENICIEFDGDGDDDIDFQRLEKLLHAVCTEFHVLNVHIQISLVDDAQMIEVHQQFLNDNSTTDVMSFDLSDDYEDQSNFQIVVNCDMARRQAEKRGHSVLSELALYMTHGLLHQLGFDDHDPQDAQKMHEKEDAVLQSHRFGVIYHKQDNNQE